MVKIAGQNKLRIKANRKAIIQLSMINFTRIILGRVKQRSIRDGMLLIKLMTVQGNSAAIKNQEEICILWMGLSRLIYQITSL